MVGKNIPVKKRDIKHAVFKMYFFIRWKGVGSALPLKKQGGNAHYFTF